MGQASACGGLQPDLPGCGEATPPCNLFRCGAGRHPAAGCQPPWPGLNVLNRAKTEVPLPCGAAFEAAEGLSSPSRRLRRPSGLTTLDPPLVGQIGNLRPIANRPARQRTSGIASQPPAIPYRTGNATATPDRTPQSTPPSRPARASKSSPRNRRSPAEPAPRPSSTAGAATPTNSISDRPSNRINS